MNKNWSKTTLGKIISEGNGKFQTGPFGSQLHASDYVKDGIPCIMPANMKNNRVDIDNIARISEKDAKRLSKHIVKKGDILYSRRGDITLKALITDKEVGYFCGTGCLLIRAGDKIDPEFLTYLLSTETNKVWIVKQAVGATMPNLNTDILSRFPLYIPSFKTQQSIAAVLSALDKKIALNKQINARLEEMAKTLYDYWFVQFDFPDANGKPYKSSGGDMVFDETLKREIPKEWEVKQISHWIKADKSGDWGKEQQEGNYTVKVNCVRGADINAINLQGNIETPIRFILAKNEHKLLSPFDFVVEISGGSPTQSTGRLAPISQYVLDRFDLPLICSNFCKAISLKDTSYFYQFAFMWSDIYKNNILFGWEGKTSGIKNLLFDNFVNGYFECFPPKEIAEQFFKIIDKNHQEQQLLLKQNHQLTQLRDFLLPMLMNGQVSVTCSGARDG